MTILLFILINVVLLIDMKCAIDLDKEIKLLENGSDAISMLDMRYSRIRIDKREFFF